MAKISAPGRPERAAIIWIALAALLDRHGEAMGAGLDFSRRATYQASVFYFFARFWGSGAGGVAASFARRKARSLSVFFSRAFASCATIPRAAALVSAAFVSALTFVGLKKFCFVAVIESSLVYTYPPPAETFLLGPRQPFTLHLLPEHPEDMIDVVVPNENLQDLSWHASRAE